LTEQINGKMPITGNDNETSWQRVMMKE
jgi:hypothetical protein